MRARSKSKGSIPNAVRAAAALALGAGLAWACGDGDAGTTQTQSSGDAAPPDDPIGSREGGLDGARDGDADTDSDAALLGCSAPQRPPPASRIVLEPVFPKLSFTYPLGLYQAPGDASRWYVIEQTGTIRAFDDTPDVATTTNMLAAPLSVELGATWEGGLLGFAFHPGYATNGTAFLAYTVRVDGHPGLTQRIARYKRNGEGRLAKDVDIFERHVPAASIREEHNLGTLAFGPDGYLYVGLGDAYVLGSNPSNPAQNLDSVFGKILRIAVGDTGPYTIPPTNPFTDRGAPEVYARGFRNPWRFSFDRGNPAHLWVADVGDDTSEEINRVEIGKNYGWSIMEGAGCHAAATCDQTGLEPPIVSYPHKLGLLAVIGGYVYRGTRSPSLVGSYFYGDYSGRIWSLPNGQAPARVELDTERPIVSFAEDNAGELYVLTNATPTAPGGIFHVAATPAGPPSKVPTRLSATGCFEPGAPTSAVSTLVPYDVNSPLWSDGAEKRRWMSIPAGAKIHVRDDGDLEPPIGTVLIKEFRLQGKPVETRLFVRHQDGDWGGYGYAWEADGSDAVLVEAERFEQRGGVEWFFPTTAQCLRCHTRAAGRTLGLELGQLNRPFTYPDGTTANQLTRLEALGLFDKPIGDPSAQPRLPDPLGADPVEARARSYLHANCAFCHRPGETPRTNHDLSFGASFAAMNVCNKVPVVSDFGIPGMRLLTPGNPTLSALAVRMRRLDGMRMPPLASTVIDDAGVAVVDAWIQSVGACP